jgi:mevalonate kinase
MTKFKTSVSVPGVINVFGGYSSQFGGPGLTFAVKQRLSLNITPSEFEFNIVDGYKMEPHIHKPFETALSRFYKGIDTTNLEFQTRSQLPPLTSTGTQTAVACAVSAAILERRRVIRSEADPELVGKKHTKPFIARKTFSLENGINPLSSPLNSSAVVSGGLISANIHKEDSLWMLPQDAMEQDALNKKTKKQKKKHQVRYTHSINIPTDVSWVLGIPKNPMISKYLDSTQKPLFDGPPGKKKKDIQNSVYNILFENNPDSIPNRMGRFISKSGFAKDNLKELGKIVNSGIEHLQAGRLEELGKLMDKQQNILTIMGVYPTELKKLVKAAAQDSYGISVVGTNDNAILCLAKDPDMAIQKLEEAGGEAIKLNISDHGLLYNK